MDYEKLIEQLKQKDGLWCSVPTGEKLVTDAADALTALLAESEKLRDELERLTVENEELKGQAMSEAMEGAISAGKLALMDRELEQVTRERDAAVDCINQIQSARDHTRPAYVVDKILSDWRGPEEG